MSCTIIFTGANGSLAIPAVRHILQSFPDYFLILTVRDTSDKDINTLRLRETIQDFPDAKTSIRHLDLANLSQVKEFSKSIAEEVADAKLPRLASIVCNAYYWNLAGASEQTADGLEKTFQVNHIAHATLVLLLLGSFSHDQPGRVVLLASDAHWPGKNVIAKLPPAIPEDLDVLVHPNDQSSQDHLATGQQKYGNSKLAIVMWMYALNRRLSADPAFSNITAVAINPGNLTDSRAMRVNTPKSLVYMSKIIIQPLRPLLRLVDPTMRLSRDAGHDIAELATNNAFPNERGYFTLLKKDTSSPDSLKENVQERLWLKTLEWAGITQNDTALKV